MSPVPFFQSFFTSVLVHLQLFKTWSESNKTFLLKNFKFSVVSWSVYYRQALEYYMCDARANQGGAIVVIHSLVNLNIRQASNFFPRTTTNGLAYFYIEYPQKYLIGLSGTRLMALFNLQGGYSLNLLGSKLQHRYFNCKSQPKTSLSLSLRIRPSYCEKLIRKS